jgi:hypothetical protein
VSDEEQSEGNHQPTQKDKTKKDKTKTKEKSASV